MTQVRSFIARATGRKNRLLSPVKIGQPFNPNSEINDPDKYQANQYTAVWDTGATNTVISKRVAEECKLESVGMSRVVTAGGVHDMPNYWVSIWLPNMVTLPHIKVTLSDSLDTDLLIGMDVIGEGDFSVNCLNGNTSFSFRIPSLECVDYTTQPPSSNQTSNVQAVDKKKTKRGPRKSTRRA